MSLDNLKGHSEMIRQYLERVRHLHSDIEYQIDRYRLRQLMNRGLKIGKNVYVLKGVDFDWSFPYLIEVGDNCRLAMNVRILAHDATTFRLLGITRIAPVRILEGTFIGERAIILPGVTIGPRALIAAGSVVNRDIPEGKAAAGNPARPYSDYTEVLHRQGQSGAASTVFDVMDIEKGIVTGQDIRRALQNNATAYVKSVPSDDRFYVNADMDQLKRDAADAYSRFLESSKNTPPKAE